MWSPEVAIRTARGQSMSLCTSKLRYSLIHTHPLLIDPFASYNTDARVTTHVPQSICGASSPSTHRYCSLAAVQELAQPCLPSSPNPTKRQSSAQCPRPPTRSRLLQSPGCTSHTRAETNGPTLASKEPPCFPMTWSATPFGSSWSTYHPLTEASYGIRRSTIPSSITRTAPSSTLSSWSTRNVWPGCRSLMRRKQSSS